MISIIDFFYFRLYNFIIEILLFTRTYKELKDTSLYNIKWNMDTNLCEKNEIEMQPDIVTLQDTLRNKNQKVEVSTCQCMVNDELTYTQIREKVSKHLC